MWSVSGKRAFPLALLVCLLLLGTTLAQVHFSKSWGPGKRNIKLVYPEWEAHFPDYEWDTHVQLIRRLCRSKGLCDDFEKVDNHQTI